MPPSRNRWRYHKHQFKGFVMCTQMVMHANAHTGCANTTREPALKDNSGRETKKLQYCTWLFGLILTTNQPSHPVPALGPLQQWNTKHKLDPELSRPSPRSVRIHKQVSRPVPVVQEGVQLWLRLCSLICHAPWCVPRCSSLQFGLQAGFPAGSNQSKQVHAGPRVRHRAVLPCLDGATWKRAVKSIFKCSDKAAGNFKLLDSVTWKWTVKTVLKCSRLDTFFYLRDPDGMTWERE